MKAVLQNIVIGALCLITVVLAAPHQSILAYTNTVKPLKFECNDLMQTACGLKECVARAIPPSAPVVHESASFLVW